MTRIVVIGGRGFFGAAVVELLRREGERPLVGSRGIGGDLRLDAEDRAALAAALRPGDVVIDAAGPFQHRSTALVETALATGCDLIDLSDSLAYALSVQKLAPRIDGAGTRVLTSCSSVSAVSAALVGLFGVARPVRVSAFLAPATRNTSTAATAESLLASLQGPIRVLRDGRLVAARAFGERRRFDFPSPVGTLRARLGEGPDAITLPLAWPSLRAVDFWVDTRRRLLNALLAAAARSAPLRRLVRLAQPLGRRVAKQFGTRSGGFGVEVEDGTGARAAAGFLHATHSYVVAVAPAVLAARAILAGRFAHSGLVRADRQIEAHELVDYLTRAGVRHFTTAP